MEIEVTFMEFHRVTNSQILSTTAFLLGNRNCLERGVNTLIDHWLTSIARREDGKIRMISTFEKP